MKKWLAIFGLVASLAAFGNEPAPHCDQFMPYGYPTVTGHAHTTQLCRIAFYTLHDDQLKVPVYSVELLLPENISGVNPRIDKFKADPDLQATARAVPGDYVGSGYDKGHMAPVEDMRKDSAAMLQSFYMSNMVPQDPILNRGVWREIEEHARKLAISKNGVYVFTGPIFADRPIKTIGAGVAVPSHTFKVIIDKNDGLGIGYIVPNTNVKGTTYKQYAVPVAEVERVTGINFTPNLTSNQDDFKKTIGQALQ
jgi:endonuclease G